MKNRTLSVFLIILAFGFSTYAHQDTIIELSDGKLTRLPEKYSPSTYSIKTRELTIGTNSVIFPSCSTNILGIINQDGHFGEASWYHEPDTLPPYLIIRSKINFNDHIMINIDTLEIIGISVKSHKPENADSIIRLLKEQWTIKKQPQPAA